MAPVIASTAPTSSPIRLALAVAWIGLLIAATAAAVTLYSVIALSERRAAFVAAVTHELRTPLTTFRMYAEMLAGGMVPADRQPTYLETLRAEADRLAHLVENVLQYARLERGRNHAPRETLAVATLVDRMSSRLAARAEQAGLKFDVACTPSIASLRLNIDGAALEQILFNLVDNACKYAAHGVDLRLHLEVDRVPRGIAWRVRDHGPGITSDGQRRLFQPFSKSVQEAAVSAPGVGLGLALSQRLARELGGTLRLERSDAEGTVFALTLPLADEPL
jgi:signal transduction histidine kinase